MPNTAVLQLSRLITLELAAVGKGVPGAVARYATLNINFRDLIRAWDIRHPELPLDELAARRSLYGFLPMIKRQVQEAVFDAVRPAAGEPADGTPEQEIERVNFRQRWMDRSDHGMAAFRLFGFLEQPVDVFPALAPGSPAHRTEPRTIVEYLGVAIERGDAQALAAIHHIFSGRVRKERKPKDWNLIGDAYRATRKILKPLHDALKTGQVLRVQRRRRSAIARRLMAADLWNPWIAADVNLVRRISGRSSRSPRLHLDEITACLIAYEYDCGISSILSRCRVG